MTLAQRLLLGVVLVVSVVVAVAVSISSSRLNGQLRQLTRAQLAREARLIAQQWMPSVNDDSLADSVGSALAHRVTLIDSTGVVLGDSEFSGGELAAMTNHNDRPEVVEARRMGHGSAERLSASEAVSELYVAIRATDARIARVSISTSELNGVVERARRDVLFSGAAALVVALAVASIFARQISKPIAELRDVAGDIAAGNLARRPSVSASGEVGELARTIARMAEQLEARLHALEKLQSVRRDFVANVSHELKTPLTAIRGFAETLTQELSADAQQARFADTIRSNAERMQRLVDDLLDLSKIESGGWTPQPTLLNADHAIGDAIMSLQDEARRKGIDLVADVADDARHLRADPIAVRQIISNLVENAIRYTPERGRIVVFTRSDKSSAVLGVRDSGTGIPAEHLPRIFERFYRVDPARSRVGGGTGLGLAIVKHLAEAHRGSVRAMSSIGEGTTIEVLFPA
jgi:signal transduction histidine kinase